MAGRREEGEPVEGRVREREGAEGEGGREETLTCLSVPELDVAVVAAAEELSAISVEADVSHCLSVT